MDPLSNSTVTPQSIKHKKLVLIFERKKNNDTLILLFRTASINGVCPSGPDALTLAPDFKSRLAALNWFLVTATTSSSIDRLKVNNLPSCNGVHPENIIHNHQ